MTIELKEMKKADRDDAEQARKAAALKKVVRLNCLSALVSRVKTLYGHRVGARTGFFDPPRLRLTGYKRNVRYWHLADIDLVRRTCPLLTRKADITGACVLAPFRPARVFWYDAVSSALGRR